MKIEVTKLKSEHNGPVYVWGVYGPTAIEEAMRYIDQRIGAIKKQLGGLLESI